MRYWRLSIPIQGVTVSGNCNECPETFYIKDFSDKSREFAVPLGCKYVLQWSIPSGTGMNENHGKMTPFNYIEFMNPP
jgi:hypothetical protein